ncbi:hypothetical protein GGU11DRAFT_758868 [Lentinula aff. detonsa]|nr:hypothetical protein GGU11DRAFT_758868 [Lentinula aff. detonsa]
MHRSWSLLSLAFIVLISLSSVCTIPVERLAAAHTKWQTNPQLHSRGLPLNDLNTLSLSSSAITIKWKELSNPIPSPDREAPDAIRAKLPLAKNKIYRLTLAAGKLLGLDIIPGKPLTIDYDSGSSFERTYAYGFVKFQIIRGRYGEGKDVEGLVYVGSHEYTQWRYGLGRI